MGRETLHHPSIHPSIHRRGREAADLVDDVGNAGAGVAGEEDGHDDEYGEVHGSRLVRVGQRSRRRQARLCHFYT